MFNSITLSQEEMDVILGGLLGDSCLSKKTNNISFRHSDKQKEYLTWKWNILKNFSSEIKDCSYENNKYFGNYFNFYANKGVASDLYGFIRMNLYKDDIKTISMKYLNELTPLAIAVWWMDDGCLSIHKGNRYGKLCTHCFSYDEHLIMKSFFKSKFDIDVDIKIEKNKYYFLRLNVENLKKLITIIYPYVTQIPSMLYKIDLNYQNTSYIGDFEEIYTYIKSCYFNGV